jgi:hypothetical protein
MTAQTVSTALNYDDASIAALANGETITLSARLTVNSDVRWNQQACVMGSISMNGSTSRGGLTIDGTTVWQIPFTASSGNVPTQAALGSNTVTGGTSGATGELLRVFATGSLTPATAGGAMPATGYIKLRTKTGTFSASETITIAAGVTITSSSAGVRSWLHVVAGEGTSLFGNRLMDLTATGDWYDLGTTNGADDQTFQFPVSDCCPAIWIETSAGSGTYEPYLNAGSRWGTATQFVPTDVRGKYFGMSNATGVITIAQRASNSCGYKPATGCKVRIGNIILSCSTATDWNANTINATLTTRYTTSTLFMVATVDKVTCNWYLNLTQALGCTVTDSTFLHAINVRQGYVSYTLVRIAIGLNGTGDYQAFSSVTSPNGFTLTDARFARYLNGTSTSLADTNNVVMTRVRSEAFGDAASADRTAVASCYSMGNVVNLTMTDCIGIGGRSLLTGINNATITRFVFADRINGTTLTTVPQSALQLQASVSNVTVTGFSFLPGVSNIHSYSAAITTNTTCNSITISDSGTFASPIDFGSVNPGAGFVSSLVTTGITVRRMYAVNNRTDAVLFSNNVFSGLIENCSGTYATTTANTSNNTIFRGVGWLFSTTAQLMGSHFYDGFTSATAGFLTVLLYEPTASTTDQCAATLSSTAGGWNGGGILYNQTVGDTVIWETPYYVLGYTSFSITDPTTTITNPSNMNLTFQYDIGSGYNGTYLALTGANLNAIGAITPSVGFKLKIKLSTTTSSATNKISLLKIPLVTNSTAQATQYPVPGIPVVLTGLVAGTEVRAYVGTDPATATEIGGIESSTTSFTFTHNNTGSAGYIVVFALGYIAITIPVTYSSSSVSFLIQQQVDRQYLNP